MAIRSQRPQTHRAQLSTAPRRRLASLPFSKLHTYLRRGESQVGGAGTVPRIEDVIDTAPADVGRRYEKNMEDEHVRREGGA